MPRIKTDFHNGFWCAFADKLTKPRDLLSDLKGTTFHDVVVRDGVGETLKELWMFGCTGLRGFIGI